MTNSLTQLVEDFRTGSITVVDYLNQIEERFDQFEPLIHAFIPETNRFRRLRLELVELVEKYPNPNQRPPLFSIPVGIKDLYHVDGFETKAGSNLPPEVLRGDEGAVIKTLKDAGALILGKTVTTEFAYFAPGPTHNPRNLKHTPGGSSSGSAAAVAAGLTPLAFGTQTIGSVIRPAAYCGVVGFKPSQGRVSTSGIIPLAPSLDQVGFFTSNVESAEFAASLICKDWNDRINFESFKLAIPEGPYLSKSNKETLEHFKNACKIISDNGFDIIQIPMMNNLEKIVEHNNNLVAAEGAVVHKDWFREYSNLYHPKTAELILRGQAIQSTELEKSRRSCTKLRDEIMGLMVIHNVDAILSPSTTGIAPLGLESTGDPVMNLPWTHAGIPVINIPFGYSNVGRIINPTYLVGNNLPLGLQVIGKYWGDVELMKIASKIEKNLFF